MQSSPIQTTQLPQQTAQTRGNRDPRRLRNQSTTLHPGLHSGLLLPPRLIPLHVRPHRLLQHCFRPLRHGDHLYKISANDPRRFHRHERALTGRFYHSHDPRLH